MDKGLLHKKATALFCHIWLAGNGLDPHDNDYFITICTCNKRHQFGHPHMLSPWGKIAEDELLAIEKHFDQVFIKKYVVMPNHIHAIVRFSRNDESEQKNRLSLSKVIGPYKSGVSRRIRKTSPNATV